MMMIKPNIEENDDDDDEDSLDKRTYIMDSDHRLLLRCTKALLQSRNSAVCINFCFKRKKKVS